jgi:hypothetical protein
MRIALFVATALVPLLGWTPASQALGEEQVERASAIRTSAVVDDASAEDASAYYVVVNDDSAFIIGIDSGGARAHLTDCDDVCTNGICDAKCRIVGGLKACYASLGFICCFNEC